MDENKNEILDEVTNGVENNAQEASESVEEVAEEVIVDELNADEEIGTFATERDIEIVELEQQVRSLKRTNKVLKAILAVILAVALCVGLAFGGVAIYNKVYNPYNHMGYYNISGMTLEEAASEAGLTLEEAIAQLGLPSNIKGDTYYDVVEFLIPVYQMAQMYGADFETLKEAFGFGEHITANSTWGEALDSMTLLKYMGSEELVDEFKAEYGFGDEVTTETLWGDIRPTVNKIDYEKHLAEMATDVFEDATELQ